MLWSVVIPVAAYHETAAPAAIASAERQSLPAAIHVVDDPAGKGAGWARNQGLARVDTPFVTFLDADDLLLPAFGVRCLSAYRTGQFIYTDWRNDTGNPVVLPDSTEARGWYHGRTFHLVTTLLPTAAARAVGGFDESLPTMEDLDFYLRLRERGICGVRWPEVLVVYRASQGRRARFAVESGQYAQRLLTFKNRYGAKTMCCGGDLGPAPSGPEGAQQPGDVLAQAIWAGVRTEGSWFAPRVYRGGNGSLVWADPRDVAARPSLFRVAPPVPGLIGPSRETVLAMLQDAAS